MKTRGQKTVLVVLLGLLLVAGAACGGPQPGDGVGTTSTSVAPTLTTVTGEGPTTSEGPSSPPGAPVILNVAKALLTEGPVRVSGALLAFYPEAAVEGGAGLGEPEVVLATALAESYPPQPGGPAIPVVGLDLADLVGLSTSTGEGEMTPATWSTYRLVLGGVIKGGVLEVTDIPEVLQATAGKVVVRFSITSGPLVSGEAEWFAFDVRNLGEGPMDLTFTSGQEVEVVLLQEGKEKYRWSEGLVFTQAFRDIDVGPGEAYPIAVYGTIAVPPGRYQLRATVLAKAVSGGEESALPVLEGVVDVF